MSQISVKSEDLTLFSVYSGDAAESRIKEGRSVTNVPGSRIGTKDLQQGYLPLHKGLLHEEEIEGLTCLNQI